MNNIEILEESIKQLEKIVKLRKQKTNNKIDFDTCIVGTKDIENLIKENKELKEEKVLNEKILYFANNTLCSYQEGYQAGLHKEITATEIVAEERERFIIGQEIKRLKDTIHELHNQLDEGNKRVKEDYIPKSKVKEKIEKLERQKETVIDEINFKAFYKITDLKNVEIGILKQLLEEGE